MDAWDGSGNGRARMRCFLMPWRGGWLRRSCYRDVSQLFFVGLSRLGGFDCEGFSHGHWVGTNRALGLRHGRYGDWWNCV